MEGARAFDQAVAALQAGGVVAFPTDTVYGIGVAVAYAASPQALAAIKGRPAAKPVAWLVGSADDLARYGEGVPAYAQALAREGWPGALTLIVRASDEVPAAFCAADGTVALRMPDSAEACALIRAVGCPLATTSANLAGAEPPRSVAETDPRVLARCAAVLAGEPLASGVPSAIVDCTGPEPRRIR